jgi:hypothetical protein
MSSPRRRLKLKLEAAPEVISEPWKGMPPPKLEYHKRTRATSEQKPQSLRSPFRLSIKGQKHYYVAEVAHGATVFNYGDTGNLNKAIAVMKEFNASKNIIKHKNGTICVVVTSKTIPLGAVN